MRDMPPLPDAPVAAPLFSRRAAFLVRHAWPALAAGIALIALDRTKFDHAVNDWFFDPAAGHFPLRNSLWLETVMHQWARYVVVLIACAVIASFFYSFATERWRPIRRLLLFLSLALTLAPGAVAAIKLASVKHCPYDLVEYGGYVEYRSLLDTPLPGVQPGRCFPSGHAAAGFALLAFYFAGLALGRPALARAGLWTGLGAGMAFGLARMAQGEHFLSHNLWSALVCWVVMLALYVAIMGTTADGRAPAPHPGEKRPAH
jgi:membrane-associated PAP2 superfamily phosphatase